MLAGYLRDIDEDAGWGIPLLRDIPWIGWLFGGKSSRKETVQRMFILTPHVVDLDAETLVRLQSARLRDIAEEEKLQDDTEVVDELRRQRELERKNANDRRREKADVKYERREAEIDHERVLRKIKRVRIDEKLEKDRREWKKIEDAEWERLEQAEGGSEEL